MADKNHTTWTKEQVERGIYRRENEAGDVRYFAQVRTRRGTATGTFDTISKARKFRERSLTDMEQGRYFGKLAGAKVGVRVAVDRFIAEKGITNPTQLGRCKFWSEHCKDLPLLELTASRVADALGELKAEGKSGATVNRYKAVLSGMWKHWARARAGSEQLVPMELNPAKSVGKESEPDARLVTLDKAQRGALLDACADDHELLAAVRLALTSGCRHGELAKLKWKDVDLIKGTAQLTKTKNGSRRAIAFDGVTLETIKKLPRGIANAPVFSERVRDRNKLRTPWKAALKRAKLADMRWHDLRHVSVQVAIESGSTLMEAGLHTGHKSMAALSRYSHLDATHQQKISARVGEAL